MLLLLSSFIILRGRFYFDSFIELLHFTVNNETFPDEKKELYQVVDDRLKGIKRSKLY